jgi:hypothetical protein
MITETCIPLTLKIMAPRLPLNEAEHVAGMILVEVVLLCALTGYTIRLPGEPEDATEEQSVNRVLSPGTVSVNYCGIFPVTAGTASGFTRSQINIR